MYFLSGEDRRRLFKGIVSRGRTMTVDESLRGWNWDKPPIEPPYDTIKLGVYEVASQYCQSGRDVFVRRIDGIKGVPSKDMVRGLVYHYAVADEISVAKAYMYKQGVLGAAGLYEHLKAKSEERFASYMLTHGEYFREAAFTEADIEEVKMNLDKLWGYEASQMAASIKAILSKQPRIGIDALVHTAIPVIVEQKIDGSALGLSTHLSVDAFSFDSIILDLKTGEEKEFHKLSTTGYALVYESIFEYPINVGCVVYVNFSNNSPVPIIKRVPHLIDETLRREFLEARDLRMKMIYDRRDPGLPRKCYAKCQYLRHCGVGPEQIEVSA
ncbi:CRISPR-associated protein, Csa1 family [Candidatus Nitrososphaera gargensis Ga9.2]|uniref:CRISPR-associated protein, Csa1 family n=1 Tax=Nitrososphaera gargensis (strain Ga9.2) TaxID=1237085 RepID=K0ICJ6_NITGG|nr:type I-A CRISPR-associated protein Cas4/Csa1 [Candidatus Nitrososphaera gargensis]AFU57325.1 CRISPR-associated protein, Csa1 family [Candidatus Nitrososphaera gargensis Ga9.2]